MKKGIMLLSIAFFIVLLQFGCSNKDSSENDKTVQLTISAAVSLTDALEEIKELYEMDHPVELTFNLAGSGTLAQQIQQGAPSDIFISANQDWMDILEEDNILLPESRTNIIGNKLVLIAHNDSSISYQSFDEISSDDLSQVAVGNPKSVPAGAYTEGVLKNLNLWDELEGKIVLAKDVRQVVTYVESGNTDIGFVYESDALNSDQVTILARADEHLYEPIIYPMAVIKDTNHKEEAKAFTDFLKTDNAQDILVKYGFRK